MSMCKQAIMSGALSGHAAVVRSKFHGLRDGCFLKWIPKTTMGFYSIQQVWMIKEMHYEDPT